MSAPIADMDEFRRTLEAHEAPSHVVDELTSSLQGLRCEHEVSSAEEGCIRPNGDPGTLKTIKVTCYDEHEKEVYSKTKTWCGA